MSEEAFAAVETTLLGEKPHLTRPEVIARAGVAEERAQSLWAAMGFSPPTSDEEVRFTDADVEAIQVLDGLVSSGMVAPEIELAVTRSMGRSFARLAEWEVSVLTERIFEPEDLVDLDPAEVDQVVTAVLPVVEQLQSYVWRRHLASAAGRLLLQATAGEATPMAVGFADIVGYTRRTRSMSTEELGVMVERFESTVTTTIAEHGGRIIKTIGDEVLYACDDPVAAARIAVALATAHDQDEEFPEVRVGTTYGDVLSRLGDVFGEPVNIASRLTSLARPGRVLVDRPLADVLRELPEEFRVKRALTVPVKGYTRLETWTVKPPKPARDDR